MRYSIQGSGQSSMGQYQRFRSDGPISHPKRRIWSSVSLVVQPSDFYLFLSSKFEVSLFKTILTKSRLCDSFLHPGTLSFTRVFSSNLLQGTVKNLLGQTTLTEDQIYRFGWKIGSSDLKPRPCPILLLSVPWIESRNIGTLYFQNYAEMIQAVPKFLAYQDTEFYQSGFFKLVARYEKCINVGGD